MPVFSLLPAEQHFSANETCKVVKNSLFGLGVAPALLSYLHMRKPPFLSHFALLLVFSLSIFLTAAISRADNTPTSKTPVASFRYGGKEITLYPTALPNFYVDQNGDTWIPANVEANPGHGQYEYKLVSNSTPEEITKAENLTATEAPGLYFDHRGQMWLKVDDKNTGKSQFIRFDLASENDLNNLPMGQQGNLTWMWLDQAKEYPGQNIKFSAAQFIVNMTTCFGMNTLTFTQASASDPTCVNDFIKQVMSPSGLVGFYAFMLASGYSAEITMRLTENVAKLAGSKLPPEVLRARFMPIFGYLGMAWGSMASQIVSHVWDNQYWAPCKARVKAEGIFNDDCQKVVISFASDPDFWGQFASGMPSLFLSSIAAHFTQQLIVNNYARFTESAFLRDMNVKVLSASEDVLKLVAKFGPRAVLGVRFIGAVVGGVPGVVVIIATEVGEFYGFLQYQEWFEFPITRAVNDLIETNRTYQGMKKIEEATTALQKNGWTAPYAADGTNCTTVRTGKYQTERHCEQEEVLPAGLALLKTGAQNFRQKVLYNQFDEANGKWAGKLMGFMNTYRASKLLLENIFFHRDQKPVLTNLSLNDAATEIAYMWTQAVAVEADYNNKGVNDLTQDLKAIVQNLNLPDAPAATAAPVKNLPAFGADLLPTAAKPMSGVLLAKATKNDLLLAALKHLQDNAGLYFEEMFPSGAFVNTCTGAPRACEAMNFTEQIRFEKLPLTSSFNASDLNESANFIAMLSGLYGSDVTNQVFGALLCGTDSGFSGTNIDNNGQTATFNLPMILNLSQDELYKFRAINCTDLSGNTKLSLEDSDFQRPWILGDRVFSDPIALLMDVGVILTPGITEKEASLTWQSKAFPVATQFLSNMTVKYNEMLHNDLFPQIPLMGGDQLLLRTRPAMRGTTLDYKIVTVDQSTFLPLPVGDQPLLIESLQGHVNYILDQIRYKAPDFPNKSQLLDEVAQKFAWHIAGLHFETDPQRYTKAWGDYQNDIKYAGADADAIKKANDDFTASIAQIAVGSSKVALIKKQRNEINGLLDKLYESLTNFPAGRLTFDVTEDYMKWTPLDEALKMEPDEYKKYIFYQLQYDSLSNILLEIRHIYDKLELQVFTTLPDETHKEQK